MHKKLMAMMVLFVLLASILVGCSGAASDSSTLTILSITEGEVFVMKAGTDDWRKASLEMSLEVGDTIKTGDDSGAEITFFDGSTIELEAGTMIEITALVSSPGTDTKTITLMQTIGTTISRVTKLLDPASTYAIETPSGVAAVRGTTLIVRIVFDDPNYEDYTVLMTCAEGDVWLTSNGMQLHIAEGYTCVIRPDGVVELIPPNEQPQEEGGGVTDEDTSDGESEEQQPDGSATDGLNNPPVAVYDATFTEKNTSVTINVLNNDSDMDGDALTVSSVTQGTHGSVVNNGGAVTYSPNSGFTGTDHFTYTVSDGRGGTDTASVTVFTIDVSELEFPVTPPPDDETPPADTETTATILITISPEPWVSIYIWDDDTYQWAIDQDTGLPVDGNNHVASDTITVDGGHSYRVWVRSCHSYDVNTYPSGWSKSALAFGGEAASGFAAAGSDYPVDFTEIIG